MARKPATRSTSATLSARNSPYGEGFLPGRKTVLALVGSDLVNATGLSRPDFEVLVRLHEAPGGTLTQRDLGESLAGRLRGCHINWNGWRDATCSPGSTGAPAGFASSDSPNTAPKRSAKPSAYTPPRSAPHFLGSLDEREKAGTRCAVPATGAGRAMTMPSIPLAKAIAPSDTSTSIVIGGSGPQIPLRQGTADDLP